MSAGMFAMLPCYLAVFVVTRAEHVTPIGKVIEMLEGMKGKGISEKHEEEVEFASFHELCDQTREEKTKSIKELTAQIEQLQADEAKAAADAGILAEEIAELESEIARETEEAEKAKALRAKEHDDYEATHADLSESIEAVAKAKQILKAKSADVPQSLAQLTSDSQLPVRVKALIQMSISEDQGSMEAPEAAAYEFQSGGVVALLEKLQGRFKDERLALEKAELNARGNHELVLNRLTKSIKVNTESRAQKTEAKSSRLEAAANAKGDAASAATVKEEDEKTLSDSEDECHARAIEFEKNQVIRAEEIKAIGEAIGIMSSEKVSGNAATYLPAASFMSSFVQIGSGSREDPGLRRQTVEFLQGRARKLGSRYLALAAARAQADPFGKVKKMVKDLIVKLMEEANAEADKHAYCQTELATNKQTREDKTAEVERLTTEADALAAESAKLAVEVQELSDAIAELQGQQSEATNLRAKEKATNNKTISDAKEAQVAVESALAILKEFYAKAATASMLQSSHTESLSDEMSESASAPYKGMQSESGGIVGMLEVVISDFARLESETAAEEASAADAYQKFMDESTESVEVKTTAMEHQERKRLRNNERERSLRSELKLTQEELDKALDYYDTLKEDCLETGFSYEKRKQAREEEIQSLTEALKMLQAENLS